MYVFVWFEQFWLIGVFSYMFIFKNQQHGYAFGEETALQIFQCFLRLAIYLFIYF